MRLRFDHLARLILTLATGGISVWMSAGRYLDPLPQSRPVERSGDLLLFGLMIGDACIAAGAAWLALGLAWTLRSEWMGPRSAATVVRAASTALLLIPVALLAAVAGGFGDEFLLQRGNFFFAYHAAALGAVALGWVALGLRGLQAKDGWSRSTTKRPRFGLVVLALLVAYQWVGYTKMFGITPQEARLAEAVLRAARSGQTDLRVADWVATSRKFACLIHDHHTREAIGESLGARYEGPLISGSDTYQLVVADPDGNGETMQFIGGTVELRKDGPLCVPTARAHIRLHVQSSNSKTPSTTAWLIEK